MKIQVTYMAQLRRLTGKAREELSLPEGSSAVDLVRALAQLHGDALAFAILDEHAAARPSLLIFRDDSQIASDAPLQDGDRLTLLTPMAGGQ